MYSRDAPVRLAALIRSGLLSLESFEVTGFLLDQTNEAVAHAAANGGPFRITVIEP
jgi:alcohol dehydrogenase